MHGNIAKQPTPLDHLGVVLTEAMSAAEAKRAPRRARWDEAVRKNSIAWREAFGYKNGPIIDHRLVDREVREMLRVVLNARLGIMFAPVFVYAESIERSLLIVGMLASPSGNGPERYAPKRWRDIQRIKA